VRIKRYSEQIIRHSVINGVHYELSRYSDNSGAYVEIIARKWTGWTWERVHYWCTCV
jgi:hypothetical protein